MVSIVILNDRANPESITQFHDELSNELPELKGNWNFSFKIFRNNPYSIAPELAETSEVSKESKFMHTFSPSYLKDSCVCLINQRSVGVFTNLNEEEIANSTRSDELMTIPSQHLHLGATTGLNDPFDMFSAHKLQSLWNLKQNIRGDGGQIYVLENGNLTIKTSNIFLHGIFKGLLVEICLDHPTVDTTHDPATLQRLFQEIIDTYKIPSGRICYDVVDSNSLDKYGDLCLQYSEILNF